MKCIQILGAAIASLVVVGCASTGFPSSIGDDVSLVAPDGMIEVGLGDSGRIEVVEFHVPPETLPAGIRAAAEREVGEGAIVAAEKEYLNGKLHWEITKQVGEFEHEVLFDESGRPLLWEIQIDSSKAPAAVISASEKAVKGSLQAVEEIRDASKALTEYHVKRRDGETRWKLEISPGGEVLRVLRETKAEIEVPVR
jgi:hypothetical protein